MGKLARTTVRPFLNMPAESRVGVTVFSPKAREAEAVRSRSTWIFIRGMLSVSIAIFG
tara:strand:+ start:20021 stop:20194 length:174 start_codon:yes stop_codon:yes gene_type:complete